MSEQNDERWYDRVGPDTPTAKLAKDLRHVAGWTLSSPPPKPLLEAATRLERLDTLLRDQLHHLWTELRDAKRRAFAADGWSIEALNVRDRIEEVTRAVGAISWESVPFEMLEDYERLHAGWGVPFEPVDWERVEHAKAIVAARQP